MELASTVNRGVVLTIDSSSGLGIAVTWADVAEAPGSGQEEPAAHRRFLVLAHQEPGVRRRPLEHVGGEVRRRIGECAVQLRRHLEPLVDGDAGKVDLPDARPGDRRARSRRARRA